MSKRDVYIAKMKASLDKWNSELHELEAKVKDASGEAKTKYEKQISDLKKYRDTVKSKLTQIQETGDESWKELKKGLDSSWSSFKKGIKEAHKKLKKEKK